MYSSSPPIFIFTSPPWRVLVGGRKISGDSIQIRPIRKDSIRRESLVLKIPQFWPPVLGANLRGVRATPAEGFDRASIASPHGIFGFNKSIRHSRRPAWRDAGRARPPISAPRQRFWRAKFGHLHFYRRTKRLFGAATASRLREAASARGRPPPPGHGGAKGSGCGAGPAVPPVTASRCVGASSGHRSDCPAALGLGPPPSHDGPPGRPNVP